LNIVYTPNKTGSYYVKDENKMTFTFKWTKNKKKLKKFKLAHFFYHITEHKHN